AQGPSWGWSHDRVLGSFGAAAVLGAVFLTRSMRHPEPVLDLSLFAHRRFALANAAMLTYSMGFFAMLLGNVLFLTSVWHHSILWAGLAITPSPLIVAAVSGPVGKVATRIGFRPVLVAGAAVYGLAILWLYARAGLSADYLGVWLPGSLVLGLGVGLTFPVLSAAAVSTLPPGRFAVGAAVSQTARQVGGAVGVAVLVAILGAPRDAAVALAGFRHLWLYIAAMTAVTGVVAGFLRRPAPAGSGPPTSR
ncbi:MAG: MFS transporter, partial [Acidobacteriota bacterium]|nr:MFS transporter [Acidobacteriota bacterium]